MEEDPTIGYSAPDFGSAGEEDFSHESEHQYVHEDEQDWFQHDAGSNEKDTEEKIYAPPPFSSPYAHRRSPYEYHYGPQTTIHYHHTHYRPPPSATAGVYGLVSRVFDDERSRNFASWTIGIGIVVALFFHFLDHFIALKRRKHEEGDPPPTWEDGVVDYIECLWARHVARPSTAPPPPGPLPELEDTFVEDDSMENSLEDRAESFSLAPAFPRRSDYPEGWLIYDPLADTVVSLDGCSDDNDDFDEGEGDGSCTAHIDSETYWCNDSHNDNNRDVVGGDSLENATMASVPNIREDEGDAMEKDLIHEQTQRQGVGEQQQTQLEGSEETNNRIMSETIPAPSNRFGMTELDEEGLDHHDKGRTSG